MKSISQPTPTRVYNLHPLMAGPITHWPAHFARIKGLGFDWVYINAFFRPGASGSIYAIADPFDLHPAVRGSDERSFEALLTHLVAKAEEHNLRLMTDLVVPHTAIDGRLVAEHPEWFRYGPEGQP